MIHCRFGDTSLKVRRNLEIAVRDRGGEHLLEGFSQGVAGFRFLKGFDAETNGLKGRWGSAVVGHDGVADVHKAKE